MLIWTVILVVKKIRSVQWKEKFVCYVSAHQKQHCGFMNEVMIADPLCIFGSCKSDVIDITRTDQYATKRIPGVQNDQLFRIPSQLVNILIIKWQWKRCLSYSQ